MVKLGTAAWAAELHPPWQLNMTWQLRLILRGRCCCYQAALNGETFELWLGVQQVC